MDKPKTLNRDFVPKEAGSIWKQHHDQQEAQRGPKERGSVQYATDQVETTGRRSALVAVDGGRRAIRQIKKHHDRAELVEQEKTATEPKKNNPSAEGAYQSSPYDRRYPSARRDGTQQTAEQRRVELGRQKAVGAIAASPFGILFSNESSTPDAVPISAAIAQVNYDFNSQLEALQGADTYDDVTIASEMADWVDVLVIFAVKTAGSNDVDATDVVTMDADRVNRLKAVFSDMNIITSTVETIHHVDSDPDDDTDDSWTEKILHITITGKTVAEMETEYGFTAQQMTAVDELLAQRDMLEELIGNLTAVSADAADILRNLPEDLAPERRAVIKTACSLVGKVNYFWGGKSLVMG